MINNSKEAYQVPWEEGGIQVLFAIELSIELVSSVQKFQMEYRHTDKTYKIICREHSNTVILEITSDLGSSFERWPMADVVSWGVDLSLYPISNKFCTDQFTPSSSYADTVQEIPAVEEPASDVSFANDKKSWPRQHIETLVALYQEQEEASKPVNSVFWSRVSASFLEDGIHYSSAQCQTKMKNLKRQYRDQKDKAGRSEAGKVVWEHFELMKGLMAPKPEGTDAITASNRWSLRTPGNFASQSSPVPEASVGSKDAEPKRANKRRCFSNAEGFQQLSNDANLRHEERLRFEQKVHQERMKVHQDKMKVKLELLEVKKEALKTVKKIFEKIE